MTEAKKGDKVKVHYTGKLKDGTVFDTSLQRDPMEFTLGEGRLIDGFEDAVIGMAPGEDKTIQIEAERAYGVYDEQLVQRIARESIPGAIDLENGLEFRATSPDGQELLLKVTEFTDSEVTMDGNHPLAGRDLTFELNLLEIVSG